MQWQRSLALSASVALASVLLFALLPAGNAAKDESRAILEAIEKYGSCVVQSTFSFNYADSRPPRTEAELRQLCKYQSEGFKCVKDNSKGSVAILRRGLLSFVASRQRHHRKYCTNLQSEQSRRFLAATKCLMEKKFETFRANDAILTQTLVEIARHNYTDSTAELKQICCTFHRNRKVFFDNIGPECEEHRPMLEELAGTIFADELNLVCDDEEKLAKVCPKVKQLDFKPDPIFRPLKGRSAASLAIYLITTLGEPNDPTVNI